MNWFKGLERRTGIFFAQFCLCLTFSFFAILLTTKTAEGAETIDGMTVVSVKVKTPGLDPREVEKRVTQKLETIIRTVKDVEIIHSTASNEWSTTFVVFKSSTNPTEALINVENAMTKIGKKFPDSVVVTKISHETATSYAEAFPKTFLPENLNERKTVFINFASNSKLSARQ